MNERPLHAEFSSGLTDEDFNILFDKADISFGMAIQCLWFDIHDYEIMYALVLKGKRS